MSGDIYPCHRFVGQSDMKLGNIRDFDVAKRKPYYENYGLSHPKCSQCFARYFCGGGCIHESLETNGSMYEPDDRWCQQLRRHVELTIVIDDQLDDFDRRYLMKSLGAPPEALQKKPKKAATKPGLAKFAQMMHAT